MPFTLLKPSGIDLTQTFAFTGSVSGAGGGITVADMYSLTGDITGDTAPITAWTRVTADSQGTLGGVTFSSGSGTFTFSTTGIYLIQFSGYVTRTSDDRSCFLRITDADNNTIAENKQAVSVANDSESFFAQCMLDVTNVSSNANKVRFGLADAGGQGQSGSGKLIGSSTENNTTCSFIRLGDT